MAEPDDLLFYEYERALEAISEQQQETLRWIESSGFVFDNIGNDPGNWQHVAFRIYLDLCKVEAYASSALAGRRVQPNNRKRG